MAELSPSTQAQCAIHRDRLARSTCDRCGNFMCTECSQGGESLLCPACVALSGTKTFPFDRANWDVGRLLDYSWNVFKDDWLMLTVCALVFFGVVGVWSLVSGALNAMVQLTAGKAAGYAFQAVTQVLSILVTGIVEMGLYRVYFDALDGKKADIGRMTSQLSKVGAFIGQRLLFLLILGVPVIAYWGVVFILTGGPHALAEGVDPKEFFTGNTQALPVIGIAALIFIGPFLYFAMPYYFATMEVVYDDHPRAWTSILNCYAITKGNRWSLFLVGLMGGVMIIVGMLFCCLPALPATALAQLLLGALYVALRTGAELPSKAAAPPAV